MAKWFGFKERKRRLGGSLELKHLQVWKITSPTLNLGWSKRLYLNFPKADGYSIGIGTFRRWRVDFKSILSEYAKLFGVDVRTSKQYGHPLVSGMVIKAAYPKCDFGWRSRLCSWPLREGIRPSIFSGLKASVAIDQAIAGDLDALEKYTQVISEEWELIWRGRSVCVLSHSWSWLQSGCQAPHCHSEHG